MRIEDSYQFDEEIQLRLPNPGFRNSRITINSLGFRGSEIPREKPSGTYRIAFLGGSTTYSTEVSSDRMTWPHLVLEALGEAHPACSLDHINAGVPGFTTRDSLKRFQFEVAALAPDLVFIYHATNDLSRNSRDAAEAQGLASVALEANLSWLSEWSMLVYLVEKNLRILAVQQAAQDDSNKLKLDSDALAGAFRANLVALVRAAKESGAKVALVTFSVRLRADQTPEEQNAAAVTSLYYMPYMTPAGLIEGFAAYNEVIRQVAQQEATILVEAAEAIPGDARHFVDSVHFSDQGSSKMAAVVSAALEKRFDQCSLAHTPE